MSEIFAREQQQYSQNEIDEISKRSNAAFKCISLKESWNAPEKSKDSERVENLKNWIKDNFTDIRKEIDNLNPSEGFCKKPEEK